MRARDIFAAARDRTDPAARSAFLDVVCAGDVALRTRIERLLAADDAPDSIFDAPPTNTPAVSDGVTRTIAPAAEEGEGPTRTLAALCAGDPANGKTRAPDEGEADIDLVALLCPRRRRARWAVWTTTRCWR